MGNTESTASSSDRKRSSKRRNKEGRGDVASRAKQVVGESVQSFQANLQTQIKHLEEQDHPAAHFLDTVCGAYMDDRDVRRSRSASFYSEDYGSEEEDDDRTYSEDETTTTTDYNNAKRGRGRERRRDEPSVGDTASYLESDYEQQDAKGRSSTSKKKTGSNSFESEDSFSRAGGTSDKSGPLGVPAEDLGGKSGASGTLPKPLASSFAKRCYFTKAGIGSSTQHYEGLTLTGNIVLMLAQAMKLKGCPTICDEDLRRVEQTYPNQFSRLPDELLLSSGWRRISKYCHFSNKAIPDGIPFFHSKQRLHPTGGYYFLLAAAVGMVRPIDVEPLTRDTLVLLETDFPSACDVAPNVLIEDPDQWTLVDKFCFFSGGPINTDEDVYYQADFDGNPIYMLAFLSPSLTPAELYKLDTPDGEPGLKSVMQVEEVESVYDLTERDFDDLRLYHLGPCRALPQYILQPVAWTKVLPPHFLQARETALQRAEDYEIEMGGMNRPPSPTRVQLHNDNIHAHAPQHLMDHGAMDHEMQPLTPHLFHAEQGMQQHLNSDGFPLQQQQHGGLTQYQQLQMQENMLDQQHHYTLQDDQMLPMDEAAESPPRSMTRAGGMDPPDDEPPSLSKRGDSIEESSYYGGQQLQFSQTIHDHNGYVYGDRHDPMMSYPKDNLLYSATERQQHMEQRYPTVENERMQFSEEADLPQQVDHLYSDSGQERLHYQENGQHQEEALYSNQQRIHYQDDEASEQIKDEEQYSNGMHYHEEEHDTPKYEDDEQNSQYYLDEPEQDEYYNVVKDKTEDSDDYHQPSLQYSEDKHAGYYSESKEDASVAHEDPPSPQEQSLSPLKYEYSADPTEDSGNDMASPASQANTQSEFSHTSSAMRGARELLKRNRQRRMELATRRSQDHSENPTPKNGHSAKYGISPQSEVSGATWESGSEVTSVVSATSSAWTENSGAPERSSRRALILQMAKARMKNNKGSGGSVAGGENTSDPEIAGTYSITEEEKKLDGPLEDDQATDIDIAGDLD